MVLRHWESMGLLRPSRVAGDRRRNRAALRVKMTSLQSALDLLQAALDCPYSDITTCPIYRANLAELLGQANSDTSATP